MKLRSGRILNYDSSKSTTSQLPVTDVPSTPSSSNSSSNHPLPTSTSSTGSSLSPSSSYPDSIPNSTLSTNPSSNSSPITACGNCDTCKKGHLNTDPVCSFGEYVPLWLRFQADKTEFYLSSSVRTQLIVTNHLLFTASKSHKKNTSHEQLNQTASVQLDSLNFF